MKKKVFVLLVVVALIAALCATFVACNKKGTDADDTIKLEPMTNIDNVDVDKTGQVVKSSIKFGLITLHDEHSTYDKNFIDAATTVCAQMGAALVVKSGIDETNACYDTAVELAEDGCDIVFADSFGHEEFMIKAAKEYPNVQFCHATGTSGRIAGVSNFQTAFANIYEGRYLAGIAAGMKLNAMMAADNTVVPKMGYVGAYPYEEVISGLTSFYLGAKSVCPSVTMKTTFTNSWYDEIAEANSATALINAGCVLISQHADSMGAPQVCETKGVPNVTYNVSTKTACPNTYLAGCKINWGTYFKYIIECVKYGKDIPDDWTGGFATGAVEVLELGDAVATGTAAAIANAKAKFEAGTLKVYDCSTFTVNGAAVTEYVANVVSDEAFTPDTNVVITSGNKTYIAESTYRSAPYFGLTIDGISPLNA
ncbi:MAG: BMP family ABC transporter substrate-binding protein [Clostridia bacterium]|nr:BMP family ABC transporter substrate-binding protein [Clostridia bacterium]